MENNDFTKESSAIGEGNRKSLEDNLLAELNESRMLKENNPTAVSIPRYGESAISPLIQDFPFIYRTSPSSPISPNHLAVNIDNKELVPFLEVLVE